MGLLDKSNKQRLGTAEMIMQEFASINKEYRIEGDWHWNYEPWNKFEKMVYSITSKIYTRIPSSYDAILVKRHELGCLKFYILDNTNHKKYELFPFKNEAGKYDLGFAIAWTLPVVKNKDKYVCVRVSQKTIQDLLTLRISENGTVK